MAHNQANTIVGTSAKLTEVGISTQLGGPGISIPEIASVLRRTTQHLGQLAGDVDGNGNRVYKTNKWAKFKSVRKANMFASQGEWWRADDGKCGLSITVYEELSDLVAAVRARSSALRWDYLPPRGEGSGHDTEPQRAGMFDGYYHLAQFPMPYLNPYSPEYEVESSGNATYASAFVVPTISDFASLCLAIADIKPNGTTDDALNEYYFGAVLINVDEPNSWCVCTSLAKIKNLTTDAGSRFTVYGIASACTSGRAYSEFVAIPFFSSEQITAPFNPSTSEDISGSFLSADNLIGSTIFARLRGKYDLSIYYEATWRYSDPWVRGNVTISVTTGPTGVDVTLHNARVDIYRLSDGDIPNGQSLGTVLLEAPGMDDRAEGTFSIDIYASEDGDFDPTEDYVLQLTCDELPSPALIGSQLIRIQS